MAAAAAAVQGRQVRAVVDERADAEGRDPVADLIERDHPARDGGRHGGERVLAEADGEWEEGRTAQPREAEDGDAEPGCVVREGSSQRERGHENDRQQVEDDPRR
jgi:hypothetical protein